jgi:hypothetical protein
MHHCDDRQALRLLHAWAALRSAPVHLAMPLSTFSLVYASNRQSSDCREGVALLGG